VHAFIPLHEGDVVAVTLFGSLQPQPRLDQVKGEALITGTHFGRTPSGEIVGWHRYDHGWTSVET
jgi:hypothetical protein